MNKSPLPFLNHILEEIDNIEKFTKGLTKEQFVSNKLKQYAVVRSLEVIGEAVKNLPLSIRNENPKVPWKEIVGTRDKIVHHYFGISYELIWMVVKEELPKLKKQISKVIKDLKEER